MSKILILSLMLMTQMAFAQFSQTALILEKEKNKALVEMVDVDSERARKELHEKLKDPQETMRTFMQAMDKVKAGETKAFSEAVLTLNLSEIDPPLRNLTGKITAERLINTIDRIAKVNYTHIPNYENGPTWFFRKQTVTVGNDIFDVEIAIGKTPEGDWKFTPETVYTIENFYQSVSHQKVVKGVTEYRSWKSSLKEKMPAWTAEEFWLFKKGQWLGLFALSVLSLGFFAFVRFIITTYLRFKVKDRALVLKTDEQFKSTLPFGLLVSSLTWLIGIRFLEFDVDVLEVFTRASYILTAFFSVWAALKVVDYVSLYFEKKTLGTNNKFDDVLVPMLKKVTKVIVVAFGILLIAHSLTFDVASILAGLGIGGVAVALAAKDTISNLFGSVTLIMDRPFQIGDYVVLEKDIQGSVEDVGFRSTRIRTPTNSLLTIPNSVLANMAIDNFGMRRVRRFKTTIRIDYRTPIKKVEQFCEGLRGLMRGNRMVQSTDQYVSVYELAQTSIDIQLSMFFLASSYEKELEERHKFIVSVLETAQQMGIILAFPTQTLFLNNETAPTA